MATNTAQQIDELEGFPEHFMGVKKEQFKTLFVNDVVDIQTYMGKPLFMTNVWNERRTMTHKEVALWVAGNAMNCMAGTSYRNWTHSPHSADQLYWNHLIWRLIHIAPLAHIFSHYSLGRRLGRTWNPVLESYQDYFDGKRMTISPSNRPLSASVIGAALFLRLFPNYQTDKQGAMELFAILDFFDASPNPDNPLISSLRKALRVTVLDQHRPLAFFWEAFIRQVYATSPQDLVAFETRDPGDGKVHHADEMAEYMNFGQRRNQAEPSNPLTEVTHENVPSNDAKQTTSVPELDKSALSSIYKTVHDGLSQSIFTVNCGGALVHKVQGKFYFVYPIVFKRIAKIHVQFNSGATLSEQTIQQALEEAKVITPMQAQLTKPNGETLPIQLAQIAGEFVLTLIPDPSSINDNPDITVTQPL